MKKFSILLTMAALLVSSSVFAGSVDYLTNQSAKFLMTFHRTASTDASADIANYNPAGTAFLAEGFYIDVSNQTLFKPYETTGTSDSVILPATAVAGTEKKYEQDQPTWLLPNVYAVYNFGQTGPGKLAAYAQFGISAGGGTLTWDDGTPAVDAALTQVFTFATFSPGTDQNYTNIRKPAKSSFEAYSVYYTLSAGAAYAFLDDMISLSLGGKVIMPKRYLELEGQDSTGAINIKGKYTYEATGYTGVIGLNVKPVKELTIAARYELETDLEFEYKKDSLTGSAVTPATSVLTSAGISDGKKFNYNLPAIFSLGAEYAITPELSVMADGTIYFMKDADLGYVAGSTTKLNSLYDNGWEAGAGITYKVMPELKVGTGFMYTESGAKNAYFSNKDAFLTCAGNPPLDSWTFGLGATYTAIENLDITLAGSWTHYIPKDYSVNSTLYGLVGTTGQPGIGLASSTTHGTYKKDVYNIGVGVGYKI